MDTDANDDAEMSVSEFMSLTGNAHDAHDMLSWSNNVANAVKKGNWEDDVKRMNEILAQEVKVMLHEVYSPPRVNQMAERLGLIPGLSLDLTVNDTDGQPWDFNVKEKRDKAEALIKNKQALLLIGSPMCTAFSSLQKMNFARMTKEQVDKVIEYGTRHLEFCMHLYKLQHMQGLYFLHEHPRKQPVGPTL